MESGRPTRKPKKSEGTKHQGVGRSAEKTIRSTEVGRKNVEFESGLIKFVFMNAQSIVNKIDLLQTQVCELKPDIIGVTESWTHDEITEEMLKINGYEIIGRRDRKDTLNGRGGGILLYSHLTNLYENTSYKSEHVVHVTVTSQDKNFKDLHIHVFYRSPNSTTEVTEDVLKYIENIPSNSILVGDFNYPEIDWSTLSSSQADGQVFLDTV